MLLDIGSNDVAHSNFSFVASNLGCGDLDASAELDCMRKVDFVDIQNFVGQYADKKASRSLGFFPIPDEKVIFSDYAGRYGMGAYSKRPAVFSTAANEGAAMAPYPPTNATERDEGTRLLFLCPASTSSRLRSEDNAVTYRFEYAGNFSNVSPKPYLGAYHDSDLAMLFGTHSDFRGKSTNFEYEVSESMQDHFLAFMKDPANGPRGLGWVPYSEGQILQFGKDDVVVREMSIAAIDGVCSTA